MFVGKVVQKVDPSANVQDPALKNALAASVPVDWVSTGFADVLLTLMEPPKFMDGKLLTATVPETGTVPVIPTVPVTAALTLPVTGSGLGVTITVVGGGPPAAAAGWLGRDDTTTAKSPKANVRSIGLPKYFMVFSSLSSCNLRRASLPIKPKVVSESAQRGVREAGEIRNTALRASLSPWLSLRISR